YIYSEGMGWDLWNLVATIGAYTLGLGVLVFIYNVALSLRSGEIAGSDPWDGMTLEWSIPSPPPGYNFASVPTVHSRDPYWAQKHPELAGHELAEGRADATRVAQHSPEVHVADAGAHGEAEHHIHMPDPSYWPLVAAFGLFLAGFG